MSGWTSPCAASLVSRANEGGRLKHGDAEREGQVLVGLGVSARGAAAPGEQRAAGCLRGGSPPGQAQAGRAATLSMLPS
eukprot:13452168-Alexandrium_andersonii.AAC.1